MKIHTKALKPLTLFKISAAFILFALSVNVCEARVSIGINLGGPAYYAPAPVYYGPPPGYYAPAQVYAPAEDYYDDVPPGAEYDNRSVDVEWVPRHFEDGYWVPGRYVEYTVTSPGPDFIWTQGRWDGRHHWHRGSWHHYR
jgi:hypothetical protein